MSCGKLAKIRWISTFLEWNFNLSVGVSVAFWQRKKKGTHTKGANG